MVTLQSDGLLIAIKLAMGLVLSGQGSRSCESRAAHHPLIRDLLYWVTGESHTASPDSVLQRIDQGGRPCYIMCHLFGQ